jgi:hypothetical protein
MVLECYQTLKLIEPRPAMFLGDATLKSIHIYITGYYQALLDQGFVTKAHTAEPFFDWIANKLGYYESNAGWVNMIVAASMGFEAKSIVWEDVLKTEKSFEQHNLSVKRFYELLEEFKLEMETAENI